MIRSLALALALALPAQAEPLARHLFGVRLRTF